jgi:hypothetical protein
MTIVRRLTFSSGNAPTEYHIQPRDQMTRRILFSGAVALCALGSTAQAQRSSPRGSNPIELGIDGGVTFYLGDISGSVISIPVQDLRVGVLVSPRWEIEPRFDFTSVHGDGFSQTVYSFVVGALYQPGGDRVGKGLYGRPFLGLTGSRDSGNGTTTSSRNGLAGLGLGLKLPWDNRRLATRTEANYTHWFRNGGGNAIGVLIGLSFFTR